MSVNDIILPYGTWPSPISAEQVAAGGVGLEGARLVSGGLCWSEARALEGGRVVLVFRDNQGHTRDLLAEPWSARSRVHEYGGGAWWVDELYIYFCNWADQRIYRFQPNAASSEPMPITPEAPSHHGWRYADGTVSPNGKWVVAIRETHIEGEEAINEIVAIASDGSMPPRVLQTGADFYAAPRCSPDGSLLSFIRWNHPNMPWDGTELCVVETDWQLNGGEVKRVDGGENIAIHGANWRRDGTLLYSSDESGYWNLSTWSAESASSQPLTSLRFEEIGAPAWVFGLQRWTELSDGTLHALVTREARDRLVRIDSNGAIEVLEERYGSLAGLASDSTRTLLLAHGATTLPTIIALDEHGKLDIIRPPESLPCESSWLSRPESIQVRVNDERDTHAFFYPPTGDAITAPAGELPPLIVIGHGGPTAHTAPALNLKIQYWTSRGFAVADVNYNGSTGFGRAYQQQLQGQWGIVDVEDCIAIARLLAAQGRVDRDRMAIRGSSAGGYTVLRALTTSDVFSAGTSLYGVAELSSLAADTHKFESRYLDGLIGPWPDAREVYVERSPINAIDQLNCPILVLQGLEDEVVPPNQAEAIITAAATKNLPHAVVWFEGEQHGFRKSENIVRSLEAELWFYGRVFGFTPASAIQPIENAVGL